MVDFRTIGIHIASLAWVAVRSFVGTLLVLMLLGAVLAGFAGYALRANTILVIVVVILVLVESIAAGVLLGGKRAMIMALSHGLKTLGLGRVVVNLVFDRLLRVSAEGADGGRGGAVVRGVEKLPLAAAEKRLSEVVNGLLSAKEGEGSWLRRKIKARLLGSVQKYTLAQFRTEGEREGGVDLAKVRDELNDNVDDLVVTKLQAGINLWTLLVLVGLPLLVAAETAALQYFFLTPR